MKKFSLRTGLLSLMTLFGGSLVHADGVNDEHKDDTSKIVTENVIPSEVRQEKLNVRSMSLSPKVVEVSNSNSYSSSCCLPAKRQRQVYLDIHIASRHGTDTFQGQEWNEENTGLGITQTWSESAHPGKLDLRWGYTLGGFKNSFDGMTTIHGSKHKGRSYYLGGVVEVSVKPAENFTLAAGGRAGGVSGYKRLITDDEVIPFVQATLRAELGRVSATIGYIPGLKRGNTYNTDAVTDVTTLNVSLRI